MKPLLITTALCFFSLASFAQFTQETQAFDPALQLSLGCRKQQDLSVSLAAGLSGRRIPISAMIGVNYSEFDVTEIRHADKHYLSTTGYNATVMLRLLNIDFRSTDFNVYATVFKNTDYIYEYGAKVGILANDRTRIYFNVADMKNNYYNSVKIGVSFSLFFLNGYSAY
jgi:hypothetical protein